MNNIKEQDRNLNKHLLQNPSLQIIIEDEVHDEDDDIEEVGEMEETEELEESEEVEDIEEIEEIETPTSHNPLKRNSIIIDGKRIFVSYNKT